MPLKSFRKKAGMTLREASEKLGITERTLIKWEAGETSPDINFVPKIKEIYNLKNGDVLELVNTAAKIKEAG